MFKWLSKFLDKPECQDFPDSVYENCERFNISLSDKEKKLLASFDCKKFTKDVDSSAYYDDNYNYYLSLESKGVIYRTEVDGFQKWHIVSNYLNTYDIFLT